MVFISFVEEEGKHPDNCLQASIKVVSTFVELEQTVKQVMSAVRQSTVVFVRSHSERFLDGALSLLLSSLADKNPSMPWETLFLGSFFIQKLVEG